MEGELRYDHCAIYSDHRTSIDTKLEIGTPTSSWNLNFNVQMYLFIMYQQK